MFFIMKFVKDISISPSDLNKDLKKIIRVKLIEDVTGTCNEKYGYYIKVIKIHEIKNGFIMDGTGDIIFKMKYEVVLLRPFVGEVCDGIIDRVVENNGGLIVKVGPFEVFISHEDIPSIYEKDTKNNCYVSTKDESDKLQKGEKVRFKYTSSQFVEGIFKPIGTMKEQYLGHIAN